MELGRLKRIRRVVSAGLLVLSGAIFVDISGVIPAQVTSTVVSFQLVPALIRSVSTFGIWTIGFLFILLLTAAFGRVYCSTLCPLGTLQDIVIFLTLRWKKHRHRRRWYAFSPPQYLVHYTLFAVIGANAILGGLFLLNLVEPFSNFGRVVADLFRPGLIALFNGVALVLESFHSYDISRFTSHGIDTEVIVGTILFFAAVIYLSSTRGRLFCNLLCPAGAFLGVVSRFSLLRLEIDRTSCDSCSLCEKVCKARCVETSSKRIDFAACVSCFNCAAACPSNSVRYAFTWSSRKVRVDAPVNPDRRRFFAYSAAPLLIAAGVSTDSTAVPGITRSGYPVTPPGSGSHDRFSSLCSACHLCVSACPTQVIQPALLGYGYSGIFQPKMDYRVNYCTYDCVLCTSVCPTGAIQPLSPEAKKEVQLGRVQFVRDDCIVVSKKRDCGACAEHCPTKAVTMIPYEGNLRIPRTNEDVCVGCGACEHACPTIPRKAIYVEANLVHRQAKKPEIKKLEPAVESGQEFPF